MVNMRDECALLEVDGCEERLPGVSIAKEGSRDCAVGAIQLYPLTSRENIHVCNIRCMYACMQEGVQHVCVCVCVHLHFVPTADL